MINDHQLMNSTKKVKNLESYIGIVFTEEIEMEINEIFKPYVLSLCSRDTFYLEDYWYNQIRCVVENNVIVMIQFN